MPAVKLAQLMEMTARELSRLSESDLRKSYQSIRTITKSRIRTFEKHGISEAVPEKIRGGLGSAKGRPTEELLQDIKQSLAWMRGKVSTYKGYREHKEHFRKEMQKSMPDLDLSDEEKLDDFGYFMGEMQERYGDMWKGISNQVRDMYRDLTELNEDPRQFMKNYDYWKENVEAVNKAKEAARAPGRRRSDKFSTYVNKLKKGKIK